MPKPKRRAPVERVERWNIGRLVPYANNPRSHTPEQVELIAASMAKFGQAQLVVVDERGEIIAGHGRVMAAAHLGWPSLMVGIAVGWTEEERRAYRIGDNQLALAADWDRALLRSELALLPSDAVGLLGFGDGDLARLLGGPEAPGEFPAFDEDVETEHSCPRCGYRWSGRADAGEQREAEVDAVAEVHTDGALPPPAEDGRRPRARARRDGRRNERAGA